MDVARRKNKMKVLQAIGICVSCIFWTSFI
jgi:hypothetical protein